MELETALRVGNSISKHKNCCSYSFNYKIIVTVKRSLGSLKDLHGATQSAVPTMCSVVTTGLSCLVLEI